MADFTETLTVTSESEHALISVLRNYASGSGYESTLKLPLRDAAAFAQGLEHFLNGAFTPALTLSDSTIQLFTMDKSALVDMEIKRAEDHPQGSYDTLSVSRKGAQTLVEGLRAL